MKLNEVFDNEHPRDGARSDAETLQLACKVMADGDTFWGRNELDLAALVLKLNEALVTRNRAAAEYLNECDNPAPDYTQRKILKDRLRALLNGAMP